MALSLRTFVCAVSVIVHLSLWSNDRMSQTLLGDETVKIDFINPSIGTIFSLQPARSLRDEQGSYSNRNVGME